MCLKHFIDQIPPEIHTITEKYKTADIVVFKPDSFVIGNNMHLIDYHFVLPTADPPPMRVGRREHRFKKGRLMAFTPETNLFCMREAPTRQYTAISIKKDFFQSIAKDAVEKKAVSFSTMHNPYSTKLIYFIDSLEEELANFNESCPLMMQSISTQIVIQLLRETGNYNGTEAERLRTDKNYINRAMDYMLTYYNANIKIEDICSQIHLSPYYFVRMFKEKTGKTPHEFLLGIRIDKAEQMLRKGDYSMEEVARLSGFVNTAHFSNYFKRVKGMPPSRYKKQYLILDE